jgi:hypothetical protein
MKQTLVFYYVSFSCLKIYVMLLILCIYLSLFLYTFSYSMFQFRFYYSPGCFLKFYLIKYILIWFSNWKYDYDNCHHFSIYFPLHHYVSLKCLKFNTWNLILILIIVKYFIAFNIVFSSFPHIWSHWLFFLSPVFQGKSCKEHNCTCILLYVKLIRKHTENLISWVVQNLIFDFLIADQ